MLRSLALGGILVLALVSVGEATPTQARPTEFVGLERFAAEYVVNPDGVVDVTEKMTAKFRGGPNRGIYRTLVVEQSYEPKPQTKRIYRIENIRATATSGYSAQITTSRQGPDLEIRIGNPSETFGTATVNYTLRYQIVGALNAFDGRDELYWNVTGNRWSQIGEVTIRQRVVGTNINRVACFQGPVGSTQPCDTGRIAPDGSAEFENGALFSGGVTTAISFPAGVVNPTPAPILESTRFDISKALGITPWSVALSLVLSVALVGSVVVMVLVKGRDRQVRGDSVDQAFVTRGEGQPDERVPYLRGREIPVEFVPPDDLRPGLLGTLIDEEASTVDVTATIIDLATRGYIRIVEVEPTGLIFKSPDWRLDHMNTDHSQLEGYETTLLERLFPAGQTNVLLSALKATFSADLQTVKTGLMDTAISNGWFRGNPEAARRTLRGVSLAMFALVFIGGFFLVGWGVPFILLIPLALFGLALLIGAKYIPARTAVGTAAFRRALGFRRFIVESEKHRAQFAERATLFTEYLPYAVAFGAVTQWARTFESLGLTPENTSSWYWSSSPLSAMVLGESLSSFSTTSAGTLAATPGGSGGSGFGGGSSGGGGGGVGGGGW
jgi:uncharacterized membrane protein YgcG